MPPETDEQPSASPGAWYETREGRDAVSAEILADMTPKPAPKPAPKRPATAHPDVVAARAQLAALQQERAATAIERALMDRGVSREHHARIAKYALQLAKEYEISESGELYLVDDEGGQHFTAGSVVEQVLEVFPRLREGQASGPAQGPGGKPLHERPPRELMVMSRATATPPDPKAAKSEQQVMRGRSLHELEARELMVLARRPKAGGHAR